MRMLELRADYIELRMDSNIVFAEGITDSLGNTTGSPVFKRRGSGIQESEDDL